ncbi:MAG: YdcF family protein [Rhodospirillales bacterium]|nr:YdcF family protein [Rhodospirillales bacterium]
MFFYLSKIIWIFLDPGNLFLIVLVSGGILLVTRWRRTGLRLIGLSTLFALIIAIVPVGTWLSGVLEDRFPAIKALPDKVDGIIVLGGVINPRLTQARGQPAVGGAVERLLAFAQLAKRYPEANLVFTAGSGSLLHQNLKEAHLVGPVFEQLGVNPARIIYEDQSRNTFENATYSRRLVNPGAKENWILVTSAFHMPRAVGCFRKIGWNVIPYPVDYSTLGNNDLQLRFNFTYGAGRLGGALHEWLGLFVYWITGKTDAFIPAP